MIRFFLIAGFFALWGLTVMAFRWGLRRHMKKLMVVWLWAWSASAFTPNDGARTIVTDGTSADTQAAENYVINKAQSGWVMTIGSVNGRYTWSSQVSFNIYGNTINTYGSNPLGEVFYCWDECASTQWAVEHCPSQLMYPADYPSIQQVGQGVVGGVQGLVPGYGSNNKLNGTALFAFWALGLDASDAPFIQQGRDVFTNSVMPGYTALVYPHPLVTGGPKSIARITTLRVGTAVITH